MMMGLAAGFLNAGRAVGSVQPVAAKHAIGYPVIALGTEAVVEARLESLGRQSVDFGGGGDCLPLSLEGMGAGSSLRARLPEYMLTQQRNLLEALLTGRLRDGDGVPHKTVEAYLESISTTTTQLGEFEISMIAQMTINNISVTSVDDEHDKFFSGGNGATVTIGVVYYPEGQYGDKSAGHYRGSREIEPWVQVQHKKQKQTPSGNMGHADADRLVAGQTYNKLLVVWKASVEANRTSELAATAARALVLGPAGSFGLRGGGLDTETNHTQVADAGAISEGEPTAPTPSSTLVAPAPGGPLVAQDPSAPVIDPIHAADGAPAASPAGDTSKKRSESSGNNTRHRNEKKMPRRQLGLPKSRKRSLKGPTSF